MRRLSRISNWPVCLLAATAAACTNPAETNAVADGNAAVEITNGVTVNPELPAAGNETAPAATPAKAAPTAAAPPETYSALGQEPGWALKIGGGRIDYTGNYGEKKIEVARPDPQPVPNGRRYVTPRLTVSIAYARCNDAMSGFGFEHQVTVIADGETYKGCGGARKTKWDM
jgi:uncharacterized membrane protein